jgi:hypothetical protein
MNAFHPQRLVKVPDTLVLSAHPQDIGKKSVTVHLISKVVRTARGGEFGDGEFGDSSPDSSGNPRGDAGRTARTVRER